MHLLKYATNNGPVGTVGRLLIAARRARQLEVVSRRVDSEADTGYLDN